MQPPIAMLPHDLYSKHVTPILKLALETAISKSDLIGSNNPLSQYTQEPIDSHLEPRLNFLRDHFAKRYFHLITSKKTRTTDKTTKIMEGLNDRMVEEFLTSDLPDPKGGPSTVLDLSPGLQRCLKREIFYALKCSIDDFEVSDAAQIPVLFQFIGNNPESKKNDYSYKP